MNWTWGKTRSILLHLLYGGVGVLAVFAGKYLSGVDWSSLGPLAPMLVVAVSTVVKAIQKWASDEEAALPPEDI